MTKQLTNGKQGPGKPKAKIDPEHVKALASAGCTVEEIADFLGVNKKTLERRFLKIMEKGATPATSLSAASRSNLPCAATRRC